MNILIIGGGLCGLATALALRQAGHNVRVFERAPELKEVCAMFPPLSTLPITPRLKSEPGGTDRSWYSAITKRHAAPREMGHSRRRPRASFSTRSWKHAFLQRRHHLHATARSRD